jgi:hypothetical protein
VLLEITGRRGGRRRGRRHGRAGSRRPTAEWRLLKSEEREKVRDTIAELPQRDRDLIRWLFFEGRTKDDVCRELNVIAVLRVLFTEPSSVFASGSPPRKTDDTVTHQEALETLASERYLLNEMSDTDRDAFEEHFFDCQDCADDLRTGAAMLQGARAGFAGTATTGRTFSGAAMRPSRTVTSPVWYRSRRCRGHGGHARGQAGYRTLSCRPCAEGARQDRALAPVAVPSRGAELMVTPPQGGGPVSLTIELGDPWGGEIAYICRFRTPSSQAAPHAGTSTPLFIAPA